MSLNTTECLYSTVKNVSGNSLYFSWFPYHGKRLEDQEQASVIGHLPDAVVRAQYVTSQRYLKAFEQALKDELIEIVSLPNPVLYDPHFDHSKMLKLQNGMLFAADPCWLDESSSSVL